MTSHTIELNENQEQGWMYLYQQVNKQREEQNQLPHESVDAFMAQTIVDTGNTQFMIQAKAQRQAQVDALMKATAIADESERAAAVNAALAIGQKVVK